MPEDETRKSPNDTLADLVVDELTKAGLILDTHEAELTTKLKGEGVSQDDWNLWIDLATLPDQVEAPSP